MVGAVVFFSNLGSGLGSSSALATRSVLIAVTMKTWSPQTIGVALPRPVSGAFHLMFFFSSHLMGGSPLGAVPLASGPLQWGQLSIASSAREGAASNQVERVKRATYFMALRSP